MPGDPPSLLPLESTLDGVLGFEFVEASEERVRGRVAVEDRVRQPLGLVHGGVYAALAEMVATEATVQHVWPQGRRAAGMSNATSFLRPCTSGALRAHARVRHRGRTTWVWDVDVVDDEGRLCAVSRVTIAVMPRD